MKKAIITLCSLLVAAGAFAQGTVLFQNRVTGTLDAPVTVAGGALATGPQYVAQLLAGPSAAALAPIGSPLAFRTGAAAGFFTGGALTVDSIPAQSVGFFQVVAWDTTVGATYAAAVASGLGGVGQSAVFQNKTGGGVPPLPAEILVGGANGSPVFAAFSIPGVIPEPSVLALGVIGGLALLMRRRK